MIITVIFGFLWARDVMAPDREPASEPEPEAPAVADDGPEQEKYPRNVFLELTTLALGGVITGVVALPVLGFAVLPAFQKVELEPADLGPLDLYPENEWRESTFLLDPGSGEVSRRTAFVRSNGEVERRAEHDHPLQPLRPPRLPGSSRRPPRGRAQPRRSRPRSRAEN